MSQRPPVWSSPLTSHESAPIQRAVAESKNSARAIRSSSGVSAKKVATTTKIANGHSRRDRQKRQCGTILRTTAAFR